MAAGDGPGSGKAILFADHVEERQMGVHLREFKFNDPVVLSSVQILARGERPSGQGAGSASFAGFEGRSFPNLKTMSLNVFAADRLSPSSMMERLTLEEGITGSFIPADQRLVTDSICIRGEFMRLSVVIYGDKTEVPKEANSLSELAGVASHLRPTSAFDADQLDLADLEGAGLPDPLEGLLEIGIAGGGGLGPGMDPGGALGDAKAPVSLSQALGFGTSQESEINARIADHADWVGTLPDVLDVLDADAVVPRLEALIRDINTLAQRTSDVNAAHLSYGPVLARALHQLANRCIDRLELRPLRACLRALACALCAAPTAAEVLKRGGLSQLLAIIRDNEWTQQSAKLAALQALLQLCAHAVGMEAFLGWSQGEHGVVPSQQTGYEVIMALALDGTPGQLRLEQSAVTLLRRAGFYMALARLDGSCARLAAAESEGAAGAGDNVGEDALRGVIDALTDVACQLEELSSSVCAGPAVQDFSDSLLEPECPSADQPDGVEFGPSVVFGGSAGGGTDPFAVHPQLHGFLESFIAGRRLVPGLCMLLRRLPRLSPRDRLAAFAPLRHLICVILSCVGGAHFLAADAPALATFLSLLDGGSGGKSPGGKTGSAAAGLPAVPRFPEALARSAIGAPQLAALVTTHVRATRLVLMLVARTRQAGRHGILPEADALPLLAALHRLSARGAAGQNAVVCAFRSIFLVEWLLQQLESRLDELERAAQAATPSPPPRASLRHLVAILHAVLLGDPSGSLAERFGARCSTLAGRGLELLETGAEQADGPGGGGLDGAGSRSTYPSLEFALDSEGPEGGSLGRAVLLGRRSADTTMLAQLREIAAQLKPFEQGESEVSTAKLLACLQLPKAPKSFKRSTHEERGSKLSLLLGGYSGAGPSGVEVAEVDFVGGGEAGTEHTEPEIERERFPTGDLTQLPLLAMRLLLLRASGGTREALTIALTSATSAPDGSATRDSLAVLVPVLIRCAAALNLNLEALTLKEAGDTVDAIYVTQHSHALLLEAALQTCCHLLRGLRKTGLSQYRNTELLQALLLLADRLSAGLVGTASTLAATSDPEFRLLWRHCLVWTCRVFRVWVQSFPGATGGQLLQPLLGHARVLPCHFLPGLLLLATCGSLSPILPPVPHTFSIVAGAGGGGDAEADPHLLSQALLLPANTRAGIAAHMALRASAGGSAEKPSPFSKEGQDRGKLWGQLWGTDHEAQDWEGPDATLGVAAAAAAERDPLIQALSKRRHTAGVATALGLVGRVSARRERLSVDDLGEVVALVVQCAVSSQALLHLAAVRALEKLTRAGIPVLFWVLSLGEAALHGTSTALTEAAAAAAAAGTEVAGLSAAGGGAAGGAAKDPRDARAVSRILMLLTHFGQRSAQARQALVRQRAETLCLSVLAHSSAELPSMAVTQAIRVLGLIFCTGGDAGAPAAGAPAAGGEAAGGGSEGSSLPVASAPSVPKCRMVSKALSLLLNRNSEDGAQALAGPGALAAALELLLRLSSARSMCLNLLFSATEEISTEGSAPAGLPIKVEVSCAFRLAHCAQRLARELSGADARWEATPRGSEGEAEAEEVLAAWLHVGELLVNLCQTVLVNCPTASVFLAVVLPGGGPPPEGPPDESTLKPVLGDVQSVLSRITGRTQRAETVPLRAAALVGNLRALQRQLLDTRPGPPPATLTREELCPAAAKQSAAVESGADSSAAAGSSAASSGKDAEGNGEEEGDDDDEEVLAEIVALFDAAADLEADPEFHAVAELDIPELPPTEGRAEWEFDAAVCRRKRQAAIEKAEAAGRAKRLKQAPAPAPKADKERKRESEPSKPEKAPRKEEKPAAAPSPDAGSTAATATTATAAAATAAAPGGGQVVPVGKAAAPAAQGSAAADCLKAFVKDHPEFMRVLQNPKKSLSDPRVKTMFVKELQNYPEVKTFLAAKGLQLN